jgi:hypothetical protein
LSIATYPAAVTPVVRLTWKSTKTGTAEAVPTTKVTHAAAIHKHLLHIIALASKPNCLVPMAPDTHPVDNPMSTPQMGTDAPSSKPRANRTCRSGFDIARRS